MENLIKGIKVNGTTYQIDYPSTANRPFGQPVRETILPLQENFELPLANGPAEANFPIDIEANKEYIVTWDGTEYVCSASVDGTAYVLANDNAFAIRIQPAGDTAADIYIQGQAGTHSVKIECDTVSKISVDDIGPIYINGLVPFNLKDALKDLYGAMHNGASVDSVTTTKRFGYLIVPEQTLTFKNDGGIA